MYDRTVGIGDGILKIENSKNTLNISTMPGTNQMTDHTNNMNSIYVTLNLHLLH